MNTSPKNNSETGSGLKAHPEQLSKGNAYDRITERVIELLSKGEIPWHKPWNVQRGFPRNLVTGKPYRGVNVFLLHAMNYESPFWLTYRQAEELGAHIRKGEKSCPVVFWKRLDIEDKETHEVEKIPMLRIYSLFNAAQVEGLKDANSAAYIQNWLEALKNDNKLIVHAAAQAQRATDFILGTKFEDAPADTTIA